MKLWLLRPSDNLPNENNPWIPWFDKAFGFVVRADTEEEARRLAEDESGDEEEYDYNIATRTKTLTSTPWLDPSLSTCIELTDSGEPGIVIQDFHAA